MTEENLTNGWVKAYHPTGALVTFPLFLNEPITPEAAKLVMQSVDSILSAGFSVNLPGLEEGELAEEVTHVARREGADETAIVDFYSSNTKLEKKFLHVYMNTAEDVTAFESATGIKLDELTIYDGKSGIERTDRNAPKYIKALPRPIKTVYRINPKWDQWKQAGGEGKEPHKRLLVRYETGRTVEGTPKAGAPEAGVVATGEGVQYKKLSGDLVQMIVKETNLKPNVITPILAKLPGETISFESALKIVTSNINKDS